MLLSKKSLIFVTGKGGTGKTTATAALGLWAARQNKKVLLIELDVRSLIGQVFGRPLGYEPTVVAPNIDACYIEFVDSLTGYLHETIGFERIVKTVLKNRIVRMFLTSTPGAREMMALHRIQQLDRLQENGKRKYDLIIVDLPASGHAVSFLETPNVGAQMFASGPLRKLSDTSRAFLAQPGAGLVFVTIPEEMSVRETIETYQHVAAHVDVDMGIVIVNNVPAPVFSAEQRTAFEALRGSLNGAAPREVGGLFELAGTALKREEITAGHLAALGAGVNARVVEVRRENHASTPLLVAEAVSEQLGAAGI